MKPIVLILAVLTLTACDGGSATTDLSAQQSQLEAQLASVRRAQTATAEAIARAATAEAKQTRQAIDAANTRATAEAKQTAQVQAASTATMQAYSFQLTVTADVLTLAQHHTDATATADAAAIVRAREIQSATATAEAVEHQRLQAAQDAQAARRNAEFFSWFWPALLVLIIVAMFIFGMYAINQWVVVMTLRRAVIETRVGTLFFVRDGNAYAPQLLQPPTIPADYDTPTQAHVIDAEADLLQVNTARGTTFIAKQDPTSEAADANRKLAMRLLRAAMQQVGGQSNRLPTTKDLGWPPGTWVKAVSVLKPYVITKEGRGGGTTCAGEYRTLAELYNAVGARRITLSPAAERVTA